MNTIRSTWYGWGTLCVAGGGAYYFAKRQINADRAQRYDKERQKQERLHRLEVVGLGSSDGPPSRKKAPADTLTGTRHTKNTDPTGSPSSEASEDPAPVGRPQGNEEQKTRERSKYEAAEPYRSRKGDRFS